MVGKSIPLVSSGRRNWVYSIPISTWEDLSKEEGNVLSLETIGVRLASK